MADVIVIGAGLAGLNTARLLARSGKKVIVLEARDRVGGRTESQKLGRGIVDVGAQWVGPGQNRLLELARNYGIPIFPQHTGGKQILALGDQISTYTGTIPSIPIHALVELHLRLTSIEKQCKTVSREEPWTSKKSPEWDSISVEGWKQRNILTSGTRSSIDAAVRSIFACEPSEISFLYFMHYLHCGDGFMRLADVKNGAQQDRFLGGVQQISLAMARELGKSLKLKSPVRRINQSKTGVVVHTDRGRFEGKFAVIAIPPILASRIEFDPGLPANRNALNQRMPMGSVIKCFALYDRPFWRDRGFSGEVVSDGPCVRLTFDGTVPDSNQGAIVGFIPGETGRYWSTRTPDERRSAVLKDFARFFGPEALGPMQYIEKNWIAEEFSGGCYAGLMGPGVMTSFGSTIREPVGRIHWAGTETATEFTGYMEGALQSGERVSSEILRRGR
ncbi:MAG: flavin monoamine oxidase family protein [Spirochaetia bacterium]|nr:flavin monoamine oxidase family protein [Spirochaetia bacterium]